LIESNMLDTEDESLMTRLGHLQELLSGILVVS
jgi:hypothetical protein